MGKKERGSSEESLVPLKKLHNEYKSKNLIEDEEWEV